MTDLIVTIGIAGIDCVRLPGWVVIGVAMLLTAPRVLRQWLEQASEG